MEKVDTSGTNKMEICPSNDFANYVYVPKKQLVTISKDC